MLKKQELSFGMQKFMKFWKSSLRVVIFSSLLIGAASWFFVKEKLTRSSKKDEKITVCPKCEVCDKVVNSLQYFAKYKIFFLIFGTVNTFQTYGDCLLKLLHS